MRTIQTLVTSAELPKGPTSVARIAYFLSVLSSLPQHGILGKMLTPEVCLKLRPAVRRVSEREEERGFEAPDGMAPREQVAMHLR